MTPLPRFRPARLALVSGRRLPPARTSLPRAACRHSLGSTATRAGARLVVLVVEQMVSLRREDLTVDEIAERAGCHRTTVSKHLKRAGLTLRTDVSDESFRRRVRQVYAETGTIKSTAKRLGVGKRAVRKIMRATQ